MKLLKNFIIYHLRRTFFNSGGSQPSLVTSNSVNTTPQRTSPESLRLNKANGSSLSHSQLTDALKKTIAGDIRNRGPPPQPPAKTLQVTIIVTPHASII